MDCLDRITIDPHQMGGVPCIRELRIPVAAVVGLVAESGSDAEIRADPGDLKRDHIRQVLAGAARTKNAD
jgi:uncharacterized protein (DUF433 family)